MSDDSWKGEHFIRGLSKKTSYERNKQTNAMAQNILNKRRRALGKGLSSSNTPWAKSIRVSVINANIINKDSFE